MSGPILIGPRPATTGSIMSYSVPAETQAIYVQNYSKLTLLVSFAATAPSATDSLNNQYSGVLAPGGRDTFYVQSRGASAAERSLNAMGAFTGQVWIMPVDRTNSLANTGTISTMNDVWLSAYGPYDPPPPFPGGLPLSIDLSSQPRMVAVPMGLSHFNAGQWAVGDPSPLVLQTATISPQQLAAGIAPIYLYYSVVYATPSTTDQMAFNLEVQWRNAGGGAVGGPFVMARGAVMANVTNKTTEAWVFAPVWPFAAVGLFPAGATKADLQLTFVSGGRLTVHYTIAFWMDPTNTVGNQDIGVQALFAGTSPLF